MRRLLIACVTVILAIQTAGCGLILYPERKGQKSGRIDPGVAILDAAGLIVWIVPGLIAFGVDFVTGCIYLPGGSRASGEAPDLQVIAMAPGAVDDATVEELVRRATGLEFELDDPANRRYPVTDIGQLQLLVDRGG
jgi:hypothetical protein